MTAQKGNLLDLASGTCFTLQLRKYKSKLVVNYNFRIIHQLMCNTREFHFLVFNLFVHCPYIIRDIRKNFPFSFLANHTKQNYYKYMLTI